MPMIEAGIIEPPACPLCGAPTRLREARKSPTKSDKDIYEFQCTACRVLYPVVVNSSVQETRSQGAPVDPAGSEG